MKSSAGRSRFPEIARPGTITLTRPSSIAAADPWLALRSSLWSPRSFPNALKRPFRLLAAGASSAGEGKRRVAREWKREVPFKARALRKMR